VSPVQPLFTNQQEMTMLSYDYPILGVFWSMLIFFIWIAWIMILFRVIFDIFRSHDMVAGARRCG
jgi:hypothetical protein